MMLERWQASLQGYRFRSHRADHYEYLAHLMTEGRGRKTLHDIFQDDALRYGRKSLRGRLSRRWAERYRASGGDLAQTLAHTLPEADIHVVNNAHQAGGQALVAAFHDLARSTRLIDRARHGLWLSLASAAVIVLVGIAVLLLTPLYTVPTLQKTFQQVPPDYWGKQTVALFRFADWVQVWLPLLALSAGLAGLALFLSLPWLAGRVRWYLDGFGIWRLYRDFHGIRFLSLLVTLLSAQGSLGVPLRDALLAQWPGASRWLRWHLNTMIEHIDDGMAGAKTFGTGLLSPELYWYLTDMLAVHGMNDGLRRTRDRLESNWVDRMLSRASRLRWAVSLMAMALLLGMLFWHYTVIDELRRAMQTFYAAG